MFNNLAFGILCILSLYIMYSLFMYSREGDISNSTHGIDKQLDVNKDQVIDRLFKCVANQNPSVKWGKLLICSIVYSILLVYTLSQLKDDSLKFIVIIPLTFLLLYGLFNNLRAHGGNRELVIASSLYGVNKSLKSQASPEPTQRTSSRQPRKPSRNKARK